ncbi:Eco57I restriction-modification methylase domain-containing protein [Verrucomicrobiota bacterium]
MKNKGLFSSIFLDDLKEEVAMDDAGRGRMATLAQTWNTCDRATSEALWNSYIKQALGYLEFVPAPTPCGANLYPLYEDWGFLNCLAVLCLVEPGGDIDDDRIGRFWPGRLVGELKKRNLNWGILTDGNIWRLYSLKTSKPYEDYVELSLLPSIEANDESEYALFEKFFHKDSFAPIIEDDSDADEEALKQGVYRCRLDDDMESSENILEEWVKKPLLQQVDEILQYVCNGFIFDTKKTGEEYTEEERTDIFESAVKLLYRCLFLFYAEARQLLPSEADKAEAYCKHSIRALCQEAHKFRWGRRTENEDYDLWNHLKGLVRAVNEGDSEYGVMGYNGGLFDDEEEKFLGEHRLRNDFLARALYLLAYVEPYDGNPDDEYEIPYEDLEVRHLGELYENILEFNVMLADADRIRRRTKKSVEILLTSETKKLKGDARIKKGDVYFGESALERKQSGSYYTPESLVRFLNKKAVIAPLREQFDKDYRERFDEFLTQINKSTDSRSQSAAARSAVTLIQRFADEVVVQFTVCDPAMGSGHFLVNAANQMTDLVVQALSEIPLVNGLDNDLLCQPNYWRRLITRHCLYGVDLNPLAVYLARLSLWLNSFARDHKLTFLDQHLQTGNSLIGIRTLDQLRNIPKRKKDKKRKKTDQEEFSEWDRVTSFSVEAAKSIADIATVDEDDTDQMHDLFENAQNQAHKHLAPLADLHTAYLMDSGIDEDSYRQLVSHLARTGSIEGVGNVDLLETWEAVEAYRVRHNFFHWALAFPESMDLGFCATVGNPPWDMVTAQPAEFFGKYDKQFRSLGRSESLRRIDELCNAHPEVKDGWARHKSTFQEANAFFKEPAVYPYKPSGRNNLYHYFLHRAYDLLKPEGVIGIVLPGSFNADKGASPLRRLFFMKCSVSAFFCFSNEKFIFKNVHHAFRFIAFCAKKTGSTESFRVCFLTDPREAVHPNLLDGVLRILDRSGLQLSLSTIESLSPEKLSILEFKRQKDVDLTEHFYGTTETIGTATSEMRFNFSIEMMSNNDAWRFDNGTPSDIPVYVGRCFQQFDHRLLPVETFVPEHLLKDAYGEAASQPWEQYRLVFRDVTGGTSERTCIATLLPAGSACLETARIIYPSSEKIVPASNLQAYTLGILNSFCLDYIIRFMVRLHLSQHIMERAPFVCRSSGDMIFRALVARVARLVCDDAAMEGFWHQCYNEEWSMSDFWYPRAGSTDYGPAHEREIRANIAASAKDLTRSWATACGVHDRLPDRRDTGPRSQLRAEVDAYVAHLYDLSREDFAYILDAFPVLKKKEIKVFGEFQSKRKCLEEYDRIKQIL